MSTGIKKTLGTLGCVVVAVLAGCGGGSGSGGSTFTTSVSGSKPLTSLTDAEKTQLCKDTDKFAAGLSTSTCKLEGLLAAALASIDTAQTDANLQAACTQAYNSCVSDTAPTMCDTSLPTTCTATVSDYSACLSETSMALATLPACGTITRASLNADTGGTTASPACDALDTKCPGILN